MAVSKTSRKIASTRKSAAKKAPAIQKKYTKTEILNEIAKNTNVGKKEVMKRVQSFNFQIKKEK